MSISIEVCASRKEAVVLECTEAREKIQLAADILLLQTVSSQTLATDPHHFCVFQPFSVDIKLYSKSRDTVIANTKGLSISVKELVHLLNKQSFDGVSDLVQSITTHVVSLIEAATSAAYLSAMTDPQSKPAQPGEINIYHFERARQQVHMCYERFKSECGIHQSREHVLETSQILADSMAVIIQGCSDAAQNKNLSNVDRVQFNSCTQCLQGVTAAFLESLKAIAACHSEDNQKRCILFGKPVLAAVDTTIDFVKFPQFLGTPAILTPHSFQSLTEILGGAMAVVSSTVQILEGAKSIVNECNIGPSNLKVANGAKAVAEASKLLSMSIRRCSPTP